METKEHILKDFEFLNKGIKEFDSGISFTWGADFIAGASIGIIAIALIDLCGAKVVYVDDETWYTRQMLADEIPIFIEEHEKEIGAKPLNIPQSKRKKKVKWMAWAILGLMMVSVILMSGKVISWHVPAILLALYVGNSIWSEIRKRK